MKRMHRRRRGLLTMLAAVTAAVSIAACGGSSNSSSTTTTSKATGAKTAKTSRATLVACLKKYGVTLPSGGGFRRPGSAGTGTTPTGTTPAGAAPTDGAPSGGYPGGGAGGFGGSAAGGASSKLQKALKSCGATFGGGRARAGFTGGSRPKLSTTVLDSYVSCIRKNGYAAMPEPYASSKTTPFPASVETNAAFKKANKTCQSVLTSAFKGAADGAGGAGTSTTSTS